MLNDVIKLPWDGLKEALTRLVEEVYEGVRGNGSIMNPTTYVLKCKKGIALNL